MRQMEQRGQKEAVSTRLSALSFSHLQQNPAPLPRPEHRPDQHAQGMSPPEWQFQVSLDMGYNEDDVYEQSLRREPRSLLSVSCFLPPQLPVMADPAVLVE